jgi:ribonucleotide reductase alpha subunit
MEVHHHSHTSRKKWTHYFWEFLMLFLAVFCGFLAEYQLEHTIEHQKEKQYVRSFVNDIKNDIKQLQALDNDWKNGYKAADSLLYWLKGTEVLTNSVAAFRLIPQSISFTDFVANDGTMQQLKNSGGLRLLKKNRIVDSMMVYQRAIDRMQIKQQGMNNAQTSPYYITRLFDVVSIMKASDQNNIALLTADKKSINDAYMYIFIWRGQFELLRDFGMQARENGVRLLKAINEEYHIN